MYRSKGKLAQSKGAGPAKQLATTRNDQQNATSIFSHLRPPNIQPNYTNSDLISASKSFQPIRPLPYRPCLNTNYMTNAGSSYSLLHHSNQMHTHQAQLLSNQSESSDHYAIEPQRSSSSFDSHASHSQPLPSKSLPTSHNLSLNSSEADPIDNESNSDDESDVFSPMDKELENIEIVDDKGIVIATTRKMKPSDVYKLPSGSRILVKVNDLGQPIRAARRVLTRYMTKLVKEPNLCPPDLSDFNEAKKIFGLELLRAIREAEEHVYGVEEIEDELDMLEAPPGFAPHQWLKFKNDMKSEKAKELSRKGKEAHATQAHTHTTGTKSHAQLDDEYIVKHKEDPGPIMFFDMTHKRKDGSYVQDESRDFIMSATSKLKKLKATQGVGNEKELEGGVWQELMGEDRPGRARGYGLGVTKSQVTGFRAQVRRMRIQAPNFIDQSAQIQKLQALIDKQQETTAHTNAQLANLTNEVQIYRYAFGTSSSRPSDPLLTSAYGGYVSNSQDHVDSQSNKSAEFEVSSPRTRCDL